MTSKNRLSEALDNWQLMSLSERPKYLSSFTDGLNHQAHLIESNGAKYVLKMFSQPHKPAISSQQWAAKYGLAPPVLYFNSQYDLLLMPYIKSENPTSNSEFVIQLATTLRQLHELPSDELIKHVGEFDLIYFCETYLTTAIEINPVIAETLSNQHIKLLPALNSFMTDNLKKCICHNDLVNENIFITNDKCTFIDWEYTQLHNPWFDLAAIIYYQQLNDSEINLFLKEYFTDTGPRDSNETHMPILISSQISLLWGDILWHLASQPFDYWNNIEKKINDLKQLSAKLFIDI